MSYNEIALQKAGKQHKSELATKDAEIAALRERVAMDTINLIKGTIAHHQQEKGWSLGDALSYACDDIFYGAQIRLEALEPSNEPQ